ncbi:hypothetical protein [Kaarinaea lacus]
MKRYTGLVLILLLTGCGADVMSTSATIAAGKAKETEEAKETQEQILNQIDSAMVAGQQRLKEADQVEK